MSHGSSDSNESIRRAGSQKARSGLQSRRVDWLRTLIAKGSARLEREHLRYVPGRDTASALHCLLVDCSGSMLSGRRLARVKGVLMQLIQMAYEQRADVAIVSYSGASARVHLDATAARPLTSHHVERWLRPIRGGGATPFARGVAAAGNVLTRAARAKPEQVRWLWLLTDGRSLESPARPSDADCAVVIDCEQHRTRLARSKTLARQWHAHYRHLSEFAPVVHPEYET